MAVTLPRLPDATSIEITLTTRATIQEPVMGGTDQRIARMGDRWSVKVDCQPMYARQAMAFIALLNQGLIERVVFEIRQPGIDLKAYSDGTVVGSAAGRTLRHTGGGPAKFVGQFFSLIKDGVRYLHQINAVNGDTLTFSPMLKVPVTGGETLEFGAPKIEGYLEGNKQNWTTRFVGSTGLSFSIRESR